MRCHKAKSASGYMLSGVLQVNVLSCIFLRSVSLSTRVGSGFSCLVQEDTSQTDVGNSRALMPAPCSRAGHNCDRAWISTWLQRPLFFSSPPLLPSPAFPAILYPHATQSLPAWNHPDLVSQATLRDRMRVEVAKQRWARQFTPVRQEDISTPSHGLSSKFLDSINASVLPIEDPFFRHY